MSENEDRPSLTVVGGSGRRPARLVAGGSESPSHPIIEWGGEV